MLEYYNKLVEAGTIKRDEAQARVADKLALLALNLQDYTNNKFAILGRLIGRKPKKPTGLYIYGKVGRGKSMLMDTFFKSLHSSQKKRVHFHEFMQNIHSRLHDFRVLGSGYGESGDVVEAVARELANGIKLLCFDEYEVTDVTDAMILSKLFRAMSEQGVVFVMTSNKRPEDHYKDGLQRQSYLDFCTYLSQVVEVTSLDAKRDYRLNRKTDNDNYYIPAGYEATQKLKEKFKTISVEPLHKMKVYVNGRELSLRATGKIAFAEFTELCGQPLGNADYLEIARNFEVLFIENIPQMTEDLRNEARRFINMIDILYENKIMLIASFASELDNLYSGNTAGFEFNRTVSRLKEMRGWRRKGDEERLD